MSSTITLDSDLKKLWDKIDNTKLDSNFALSKTGRNKLIRLVDMRVQRAYNNYIVFYMARKGWYFTVFKVDNGRFGYTVQDNSNIIHVVNTQSTPSQVVEAIRLYGS